MIPIPSPLLIKAGAIAVAVGAFGWWCYDAGRDSRAEEVAALTAVGAAQTAAARKQTLEVADAQKAHLDVWRRTRRDADDAWLRLKSASAGRVPAVCPQHGGAATDPGDGLEAVSRPSDRDVLPAVVEALQVGERLEATLALCQAELRQCAALR